MVTFMATLGEHVHAAPQPHAAPRAHTTHRYIRKNKTQATTLGFNLKW